MAHAPRGRPGWFENRQARCWGESPLSPPLSPHRVSQPETLRRSGAHALSLCLPLSLPPHLSLVPFHGPGDPACFRLPPLGHTDWHDTKSPWEGYQKDSKTFHPCTHAHTHMGICTHTWVCVCASMSTWAHENTHVHRHARTHKYIHGYVWACTHTRTSVCAHKTHKHTCGCAQGTHVHTRGHPCAHTNTREYAWAFAHENIHVHMGTHAHTSTYTWICLGMRMHTHTRLLQSGSRTSPSPGLEAPGAVAEAPGDPIAFCRKCRPRPHPALHRVRAVGACWPVLLLASPHECPAPGAARNRTRAGISKHRTYFLPRVTLCSLVRPGITDKQWPAGTLSYGFNFFILKKTWIFCFTKSSHPPHNFVKWEVLFYLIS